MAKYVSPTSTQVLEETAVDSSYRGQPIRFFDSEGILKETGIVLGVSTPRPLEEMDETAKAKWRNIYGVEDTKGYMKVYYGFPIRYVNPVDEWFNNKFLRGMLNRVYYIPIIGTKIYEMTEDMRYNIGGIEFTIVLWNDDFHSRLSADGIDILNIRDQRILHTLYSIPFIDAEEKTIYAPMRKLEFEDIRYFQEMKGQVEQMNKRMKTIESENEILRERLSIDEALISDLKRKNISESARDELRKQKILQEVDRSVTGPLETGESELAE